MKQPDSDPQRHNKAIIVGSAVVGLGALLLTGVGAKAYTHTELQHVNYTDVDPLHMNHDLRPDKVPSDATSPTNIPRSPASSQPDAPKLYIDL